MRNSAATIAILNFLTGVLLVSGAPGNRIQGSGRSSDGIVLFPNLSVATMLSALGMSDLRPPPPEAAGMEAADHGVGAVSPSGGRGKGERVRLAMCARRLGQCAEIATTMPTSATRAPIYDCFASTAFNSEASKALPFGTALSLARCNGPHHVISDRLGTHTVRRRPTRSHDQAGRRRFSPADHAGEQTRPDSFSNCVFSQIVPSKRTLLQVGHRGTTQIHCRVGPHSGVGLACAGLCASAAMPTAMATPQKESIPNLQVMPSLFIVSSISDSMTPPPRRSSDGA